MSLLHPGMTTPVLQTRQLEPNGAASGLKRQRHSLHHVNSSPVSTRCDAQQTCTRAPHSSHSEALTAAHGGREQGGGARGEERMPIAGELGGARLERRLGAPENVRSIHGAAAHRAFDFRTRGRAPGPSRCCPAPPPHTAAAAARAPRPARRRPGRSARAASSRASRRAPRRDLRARGAAADGKRRRRAGGRWAQQRVRGCLQKRMARMLRRWHVALARAGRPLCAARGEERRVPWLCAGRFALIASPTHVRRWRGSSGSAARSAERRARSARPSPPLPSLPSCISRLAATW